MRALIDKVFAVPDYYPFCCITASDQGLKKHTCRAQRCGKQVYRAVLYSAEAVWAMISLAVASSTNSVVKSQRDDSRNHVALRMPSLDVPLVYRVSVVQFVGVLLRPVPSVVTRFMENGSVETLLVSSDRPATKQLVARMAVEAAKGVIHLHRCVTQTRKRGQANSTIVTLLVAWYAHGGTIASDERCRQ